MKKIIIVIKCIIFIGILLGIILAIQPVFQVKTGHRGTDNIKGFYNLPSNSVDVVFVGASTMFCTADPLQLYEERGITSYDLCSSVQPVALSSLCVEELFKTQSPKVVVFETTICTKELDEGGLAYGINDMPLNSIKIKALVDMFPSEKEKILKYIFPILQYKGRWQEFEKADFTLEPESWDRYSMGAYTPDKISDEPLDFSQYEVEGISTIPEKNIEYIKKIKAICQSNGAQLVLFKSPSIGWTKADTNAIENLSEQENILFVETYSMLDELGIDSATDFRDNSHLNRYGIKKTTSWIGKFLKENYDLKDYRDSETANLWKDNIAKRNRDYYNQHLRKIDSFEEYIKTISLDGYTLAIQFAGENNDADKKMLEGICNGMTDGGLILSDSGRDCKQIVPGEKDFVWTNKCDSIRMNGYTITYNGEVMNLVDDGIILLVYDQYMGQLVDIVAFDTYGGGYATRE